MHNSSICLGFYLRVYRLSLQRVSGSFFILQRFSRESVIEKGTLELVDIGLYKKPPGVNAKMSQNVLFLLHILATGSILIYLQCMFHLNRNTLQIVYLELRHDANRLRRVITMFLFLVLRKTGDRFEKYTIFCFYYHKFLCLQKCNLKPVGLIPCEPNCQNQKTKVRFLTKSNNCMIYTLI